MTWVDAFRPGTRWRHERARLVILSGTAAAARQLIGRETELGAIATALAAARHGHPSILLVEGEAGIGKTRLVGEASILARSEDITVLSGGTAHLAGQDLPFGPVASALRGVVNWPTALSDAGWEIGGSDI